jgi:SAM-dependent methyltransferase
MASKQLLFRVLYALGFTPWDGHPHSARLRDLVEGPDALAPASALDVGCGTGDSSLYLHDHGWQVTGIDFTPKALDSARAKASAAGAAVDFVHADVTHLSEAGISGPFRLIVDNGCFHGMSDGDRDLYAHEITAAAAPQARLFMVAFTPTGRFGPAGVKQADIERRLTPDWTLQSAIDEPRWTDQSRFASRFTARSYVFARNE